MNIRHVAFACAALSSLASLQAADIFQTGNNEQWNSAGNWGSVPTAGNNYFTVSGKQGPTSAFTTNGKTWQATSTIRDNLAGNGSFNGDSLVLTANTRLLGKVQDGGTSTVNLVFGGGFYFSGTNGAGSATLAGTMRFADGTNLGAIAINRAQAVALTINSTIIGGSSNTLQLTLSAESGIGGGSSIVVTGDLSGFAGTLYVGTATAAVNGANPSSFYSVRSSSPFATLNIDTNTLLWGTNEYTSRYNLFNDVTFGSLIVGGTTLGAGTYSSADLNNLFVGGWAPFTGAGSITVAAVPEPSTYALGMAALLVGLIAVRRRRLRMAA